MGLQSDGTAILGDRLRISYGSTFGVPQNITWYKNGSVVQTNSVGDKVTDGLFLDVDATTYGTGTYKATVTSVSGTVGETNEIIVTDKEEAGQILSFTLEDDYTDGEDLDYDATDNKVVATITMKKNFDGTSGIYKKTDTGFAQEIDTLDTDTVKATQTASKAVTFPGTADGNDSVLTTNQATNYQVLNNVAAGRGLGYIAPDGTVTYKFVVSAGLDRATDYVVTFDQDSITTDTPKTGKANVFTDAATAPYVTAPTKIAVTKVSNGIKPEVTFYGEGDEVLTWMGTGSSASVAGTNDTLKDCGFAEGNIYYATTATNDTTKAAGHIDPDIDAAECFEKGVWTSSKDANGNAYWFAQVKTTKGVFAKDSVTLTSDVKASAQDAADMINIVQNKDTATSADVKFKNLRTAGTVYVVNGEKLSDAQWTGTNADKIAALYESFKVDDATTYTAKASVTAGQDVTVENAIVKFEGTTVRKNFYIAIFIPDDEVNFGKIYTDGKRENGDAVSAWNSNNDLDSTQTDDSEGVEISQKLVTYGIKDTAKGKKDADTFELTVKDQFGDDALATAIATINLDYVMAQADESVTPFTEKTDIPNGAILDLSNTGKTVTIAQYGEPTKKGEIDFLRLNDTQYLVATCTTAASQTTSEWTFEIKSYDTTPKATVGAYEGNFVVADVVTSVGAISAIESSDLSGSTVLVESAVADGILALSDKNNWDDANADDAFWYPVGTFTSGKNGNVTLTDADAVEGLEGETNYYVWAVPYDLDMYNPVVSTVTVSDAAELDLEAIPDTTIAVTTATSGSITTGTDAFAFVDQYGNSIDITQVSAQELTKAATSTGDATGTITVTAKGVANVTMTTGTKAGAESLSYADNTNGLTWTVTGTAGTDGAATVEWTISVAKKAA